LVLPLSNDVPLSSPCLFIFHSSFPQNTANVLRPVTAQGRITLVSESSRSVWNVKTFTSENGAYVCWWDGSWLPLGPKLQESPSSVLRQPNCVCKIKPFAYL
jgi:hypothetical protein